MHPLRIVPAGDAALLVRLPEVIDPAVNAWCVALAREVVRRLGAAVRDAVVGYCTVTVYFDPLRVDADWLEQEIASVAGALDEEAAPSGAIVDVPVVYGGTFGPDLDDVARFGGCSPEEVVAWHAAVTYRVYLIGFVPGFAYLAPVDPRIAAPRRHTPRTAVPAGSVAIGGAQTGVYPDVTPGGWNIIGRTPVKPFDRTRAEPSLVGPGDHVRFRPITPDEFTHLAREQ